MPHRVDQNSTDNKSQPSPPPIATLSALSPAESASFKPPTSKPLHMMYSSSTSSSAPSPRPQYNYPDFRDTDSGHSFQGTPPALNGAYTASDSGPTETFAPPVATVNGWNNGDGSPGNTYTRGYSTSTPSTYGPLAGSRYTGAVSPVSYSPSYNGAQHSQYQTPGANANNGAQNYPIQYTDDASTKLNDRVRRRCFNCCTSDTSTWRRSNLNPGKVLCNKCGLFERTHSRSRPEQFPHRRGPLAAAMVRRSSPSFNGQHISEGSPHMRHSQLDRDRNDHRPPQEQPQYPSHPTPSPHMNGSPRNMYMAPSSTPQPPGVTSEQGNRDIPSSSQNQLPPMSPYDNTTSSRSRSSSQNSVASNAPHILPEIQSWRRDEPGANVRSAHGAPFEPPRAHPPRSPIPALARVPAMDRDR